MPDDKKPHETFHPETSSHNLLCIAAYHKDGPEKDAAIMMLYERTKNMHSEGSFHFLETCKCLAILLLRTGHVAAIKVGNEFIKSCVSSGSYHELLGFSKLHILPGSLRAHAKQQLQHAGYEFAAKCAREGNFYALLSFSNPPGFDTSINVYASGKLGEAAYNFIANCAKSGCFLDLLSFFGQSGLSPNFKTHADSLLREAAINCLSGNKGEFSPDYHAELMEIEAYSPLDSWIRETATEKLGLIAAGLVVENLSPEEITRREKAECERKLALQKGNAPADASSDADGINIIDSAEEPQDNALAITPPPLAANANTGTSGLVDTRKWNLTEDVQAGKAANGTGGIHITDESIEDDNAFLLGGIWPNGKTTRTGNGNADVGFQKPHPGVLGKGQPVIAATSTKPSGKIAR